VQVHGGVWCELDRQKDSAHNITMAQAGVVVAAIDFRMPPEAGYPASIADINYAVRWLKAHAAEFASRSELVGLMGTSSGGHQAMLAAMRPRDPRYAAVPLPKGSPDFDAAVPYAVLCYPAIDPLARYRHALRMEKEGGDWGRKFAQRILPRHHRYWGDEAAMAEGNPLLALERGEAVDLPPVICVQSTGDNAHPRPALERFAELYRQAGGDIAVHFFEHIESDFMPIDPSSQASVGATRKLVEFIHRHASAARAPEPDPAR
jgi:acetyl esterase